jgi:YggT family protein
MDVLLSVIFLVLRLFQLILLVRVLLSFFPDIDRSNPIVQFLYDITEPVLQPIRDMLPQTGMVDWSPMVVFLGIFVLMQVLTIMT